ncbi:hypothetical protein [Planctellipticum variicoloris]|uniref:hypothetical protein n=1 Tax=Planctellipticum variicoloris TaxID=3064265 RepID=UPI003013A244|nr:hypothetical protein SH412_002003 [Planctomycetaceae bacterium SH412]
MSFSAAAAGAFKTLRRLAGTDVTYDLGTGFSLTLRVVRDRSTVASEQDEVEESWTACDWLLLASELVVDDVMFRPEPGHEIQVGGEIYAALPDQDACFGYEDPGRAVIRLHTKLIG